MINGLISIYTPTYNTGALLNQVYASVCEQTYRDWEWVICDDGSDAATRKIIEGIADSDERVKVFYFENCGSIGAMKKRCTERCNGELLVELDHDDRLTRDCLFEIKKAFKKHPMAGMAYSNFTEVDDQGVCHVYDAPYWRYRDTYYGGKCYKEALAPDIYGKLEQFPKPNIHFWIFMPNHVRAFRASELFRVGGYDETLIYADDYDLIIRMYLHSKIVHIPKLLYLYRWGNNTWRNHNKDLQIKMAQIRDKYFPLKRLDIGCGAYKKEGYEGVDSFAYEGVDHVLDFATEGLSRFPESSVDEIRAIDFIEHIADKVFTLEHIYRALKHGGTAYIQVPSTDGRGAFQDPTHKSFWNENSFLDMYMNGYYRYGANYNFKVESLSTTPMNAQSVCWVQVLLRADKSGEKQS